MVTKTLRRMGPRRARGLVIGVGLVVLLVVAIVMYSRRVDPVEVAATLLFIPIFIAFVIWDYRGGLIAAVLAAAAYALLRYPAIEAVGADRFAGLIASRSLAFIAFGAIGGAANRQLEASITKLELYDQIDDVTGLFNARFFIQDTDLEMSRAQRYQTIFSVSAVYIPADALYSLSRRSRSRLLRDLGRLLRDGVRSVDRAVHARNGAQHRLAVVLPETAAAGARIFTERLAQKVTEYLKDRGALIKEQLVARSFTYPGDEAGLSQLRDEFAAIDKAEHPEAA
jgi:GGDEF domain-containing protein